MDGVDVNSVDWLDSELITAYDIALELKSSKDKKESSKYKNKWNVGDYCRSLNPVDGKYHEATVISVDRNVCTVEILGHGNIAHVKISTLQKSDGKKARRKQIKASMGDSYDSDSPIDWNAGEYCRALNPDDGRYHEAKVIYVGRFVRTVEFLGRDSIANVDPRTLKESEGKKARRKQIKASMGDSYDYNSSIDESESDGDTSDASVVSRMANATMYEAASHQQYPAPAPPMANYAPPMPAILPIMPQYSAPPAPPMPQCPGLADNSAFSTLLTSLYMTGYYMGINSVQKENHGCQRCCNLSNPFHRN